MALAAFSRVRSRVRVPSTFPHFAVAFQESTTGSAIEDPRVDTGAQAGPSGDCSPVPWILPRSRGFSVEGNRLRDFRFAFIT